MQTLHIVRRREDVSETVESVMAAQGPAEGVQVLALADAEVEPERGGQELLAAIRAAEQVVCW